MNIVTEIVQSMTRIKVEDESDESLSSTYELLQHVINHNRGVVNIKHAPVPLIDAIDEKLSARLFQSEHYSEIRNKVKSRTVDITDLTVDSRRPANLYFFLTFDDATFKRSVASTAIPGVTAEVLEGSLSNAELQLHYEGLFSLTLSQQWQDVLGFSLIGNTKPRMRLVLKLLSGPQISQLIGNSGKLSCRSDLFKYWAREISQAFAALRDQCHLFLAEPLTLQHFFIENHGVDIVCAHARFSESPCVDIRENLRSVLSAIAEEEFEEWPEELKNDFDADAAYFKDINIEAMLEDCDKRRYKIDDQVTNL